MVNDKMENKNGMSYSQIPVTPTLRELKFSTPPILSKIILKGGYEDVPQYLETHFRLLREDFIRPLRQSLRNYFRYIFRKNTNHFTDNLDFYRGIKIQHRPYDRQDDIYIIRFQESLMMDGKSKSLKAGSLLCLSEDGFKTMLLAVVRHFDGLEDHLHQGEVVAQIEEDFFWHQDKEFIALKSTAYFEAYNHILRCLQKINPLMLPLSDHIIFSKLNILPPIFLTENVRFNLSCLKSISKHEGNQVLTNECCLPDEEHKDKEQCLVPILEKSVWPSAASIGLDDSQLLAMQLTFSHSVTLIQGPPGTGKSFLGVKIIQTYLANRKQWWHAEDPHPILVVSLTNHALDQFLEKILDITENVIRVGNRSQSKLLEKRNLKYLRELRNKYDKLNAEINQMENKIKSLETFIGQLKTHILNEDQLNVPKTDEILRLGLLSRNDKVHNDTSLYDWLGLTFHRDIFEDFLSLFETSVSEIEKDKNSKIKDKKLVQEMNNNTLSITQETETKKLQMSLRLRQFCKTKLIEVGELDKILYHFTHVNLFGNELNDKLKEKAKKKKEMAREELIKEDEMTDEEVKNIVDIWMLPSEDRWRLYRRWVSFVCQDKAEQLLDLQILREAKKRILSRLSEDLKNDSLKECDVIGMTTTGAAKHWQVLQEIGCQIVIVEEAAKTLESHTICSLNPQTKHLILIGDHQQLRPQLAVQNMAKEYNLDVSLFERLILNDFPFAVLSQQHRMRPEISSIIRRHFYPNLKDHPSVKQYPAIKGVKNNVFFINVSAKEEEIRSPTITYRNLFEAKFVVSLFQYLIKQGYRRKNISILTTYSGQMLALQNMLSRLFAEMNGIFVGTVDSYQGKENDIILLSLVRSNKNGTVGFLKEKNRMNVAFSRARLGLYVIGNLSFLAKNSVFWDEIYSGLKRDNLVGPSLEVYCQNHPTIINRIAWSEEFTRISPYGGCTKPCREILVCGHNCGLKCHTIAHKCFAIIKKCLPCGHEMWLPCDTNLSTIDCKKCSSE